MLPAAVERLGRADVVRDVGEDVLADPSQVRPSERDLGQVGGALELVEHDAHDDREERGRDRHLDEREAGRAPASAAG